MLQFIVLGLIPGTHIQITFLSYWVILALLLGGGTYKLSRWHANKIRHNVQDQLSIISLSSLNQA